MEEEWVQTIFGQLSPNFTEFAQNTVKGRVEPAIQGELKDSESDDGSGGSNLFQVTELDLGSAKPAISNLTTHKHETDEKSICIDFDIEYSGDCSIQVSAIGIPCGVRDLTLKGRGRIVLKPRMSRPPFFGGIQFCLLDEIDIDFDLEGLADVCDTWSFVRRKIRNAIVKDASKAIVFPNKIFVPTSSGEDPMSIRCFDPTGVVAIKVNSGSGLPRKGGLRSLVGQDKPDTYVVVKSGGDKHVTSVVKNCADPVWDDAQWVYFLMETPRGHRISLTAFDEDSMSKDDFMGKAWFSVEDVASAGDEQEMSLQLEDCARENPEQKYEVSGELNLSAKWMALNSTPDGAAVAVVTIFVYSANTLVSTQNADGVPDEVSVNITVTGQPVKTSEVEKNTQHPTFNEDFTFLVSDPSSVLDGSVTFDVMENSSQFGSIEILMAELMEAPIKRKMYPISQEEGSMATITLSAKITFA